tara:strand:+ start:1361 stop:1495 length:135 start_codon:yes stop_codon:yes gene_type:complete
MFLKSPRVAFQKFKLDSETKKEFANSQFAQRWSKKLQWLAKIET